MSKYIRLIHCAEVGCTESAFYGYDNKREEKDHSQRLRDKPYKCLIHSQPEKLLSVTNLKRTTELVAMKSEKHSSLEGLFWNGTNGFAFGHGWNAYAKEFPPGTIVRETVEVILPEVVQKPDD